MRDNVPDVYAINGGKKMGFSRVLAAMDQRRAELGVKQGVAFLQVQDIGSEVEYIAYRRQGRRPLGTYFNISIQRYSLII